MDIEDTWRAVDTERHKLHRLLQGLSPHQWRHHSLCDGWQVRDVVAHLVLASHARVPQLVISLIRARGDLDRMGRDTALRHAAAADDAELLRQFNDTIGSRSTILGTTPTDRLMDLLVHGQDIAIPLGIRHEMPPAAAQAALERIWNPRFPFRATTTLNGLRLHATDTGWTGGDGLRVEGPASALLLLAAGRTAAALPALGGDGAESLRAGQAR